jgi:hypothetical protein
MSNLAFIIDGQTDTALALFERPELAERERARLEPDGRGRFTVEPYRTAGGSARRINQIGGRLAAYTFG